MPVDRAKATLARPRDHLLGPRGLLDVVWWVSLGLVVLTFASIGVVSSPLRPLLLVVAGPTGMTALFAAVGPWRHGPRRPTPALAVVGVGVGVCALVGYGHQLVPALTVTAALGATSPSVWRWLAGPVRDHSSLGPPTGR